MHQSGGGGVQRQGAVQRQGTVTSPVNPLCESILLTGTNKVRRIVGASRNTINVVRMRQLSEEGRRNDVTFLHLRRQHLSTRRRQYLIRHSVCINNIHAYTTGGDP